MPSAQIADNRVENMAPSNGNATSGRLPGFLPLWARIIPFVFSAILYLSALFSVFSPLPLLILFFRSGRRWAWVAALTNSLIVGFLGGVPSLVVYLVLVVAGSISLAEALRFWRSPDKAVLASLAVIAFTGSLALGIYLQTQHLSLSQEFSRAISEWLDYLVRTIPQENQAQLMGSAEVEEWKRELLREMPSAIAIFVLAMVWANLMMLFRANPSQLREKLGIQASFFQTWKAPEFLVWPTIVCGFFLLVKVGVVSVIAMNLFKFFMAIYAIQGLSVLSFFLSAWNIRGGLRTLAFGVALFLMTPLLLSLGFFDLWFDFRAKFRQS